MTNTTMQPATASRSEPVPEEAFSGLSNVVLSGTRRQFCAADITGPLSIKAVLSGSVIWEVGGRRFVVRENSYLVVNQGQPYTFIIDSAIPSTTRSVFFQHGFVQEVHRDLTQPDRVLLDAPGVAQPGALIFRQCLEPDPSAVLLALSRLNAVTAGAQISRTAAEEAYLRIARALVQEFPRVEEATNRISASCASTRQELMRRILIGRDFLLSRMDESISIADAARAACMSRYHFFRVFNAAFRLTPHQFLTTQRLARARALLRSGNQTVTEVCLASGFQSPASFSLLFRRHFGVSPQEEQRRHGVKKCFGGFAPLKISTFR